MVGETRTPVSHIKEFKPNAKSSKIPLEGFREGLSKGSDKLFKFVAGFEPCKDKTGCGKDTWEVVEVRDAGCWA